MPACRSLTNGFCSSSALLGVGEGREEEREMRSATKPKASELQGIIIRKPIKMYRAGEGHVFITEFMTKRKDHYLTLEPPPKRD